MALAHLQVVDKHLSILAKKHIETRFIKIHAEKSPFLAEKLKIVVLPTIALIKNAKVDDYVVISYRKLCCTNLQLHFLTLTFSSLFMLLCIDLILVYFRSDLMSLVGQMSSAQRNWRRGWLKLKLSFSRANRHYRHPSLVHNQGA